MGIDHQKEENNYALSMLYISFVNGVIFLLISSQVYENDRLLGFLSLCFAKKSVSSAEVMTEIWDEIQHLFIVIDYWLYDTNARNF